MDNFSPGERIFSFIAAFEPGPLGPIEAYQLKTETLFREKFQSILQGADRSLIIKTEKF